MAKPYQDLECTSECRLKQHAEFILACVALNNLRLLQHCSSVCANYLRISDGQRRTPLLVAASMGHQRIVEWLVEKKAVPVDVRDLESGWTPLHRSLFFGHLGTAVYLVKNGANTKQKDYDGLEPLSLLGDQLMTLKKEQAVANVYLYTWGTNINTTLGHDHTRKHPEKLDTSEQIITQVVLCKFHSVFLSKAGRVLTSGHGQGGRLGHGNELSVMAPKMVEALVFQHCIQVAAARDHTVLLTESGLVYSCGLNDAHQLGHGTNLTNCPTVFLLPKPIKVLKNIISVGVGRYHTAACSTSELYTFGKNLGQLGFEKTYDTQIAPRSVPGVSVDTEDSISHLSVSDAGTACLTKKNRIFLCTEFTVKTIKCGFFDRMECLQFALRASLTDLETKREREIQPLSVVMLDSEHKLWCWSPSKKGNTPSIVSGLAKLNATSFALGKSLTVVTVQGEAYTGPLHPDGAHLSKMSHVQNATAIFTDFKGNNFAYLQSVYRPPTLPQVSASTLAQDFCSILDDGHLNDITVSLMNQQGHPGFIAHKAVLASCSSVLHTLLEGHTTHSLPAGVKSFTDAGLVLDTGCLQAVQALLYFMYGAQVTITCNKDPSGMVRVRPGDHHGPNLEPPDHTSGEICEKVIYCESARNVLHELLILASHFRMDSLKKQINDALDLKKSKLTSVTLPASLPAIHEGSAFADLVLVSSEGTHMSCHRCVLVARSEYFSSMLLMGWRESSDASRKLNLMISHHVLQAVMDYIYTDKVSANYSQSIESISAVLIVADQLLMTRLKETCEQALANTITLKNVADIAHFAVTYGADQLKKACLQFICINATSLLDGRYLDSLDPSLFDELSATCHHMVDVNVKKQQIKFAHPDQSMLPMSYFADDDEDISETKETNMQRDTRDRTVCSMEDTSSSLMVRPVVSGKKKRRRKYSAGDQLASSPVGAGTPLVCGHNTSSPPTSPAEKDVENVESPKVSVQSFQFKSQIDSSDMERKSTVGRGAWSATTCSPLSIKGTSSLREIMAHEELLIQKPSAKPPNVLELSTQSPPTKVLSPAKSNLGLTTSLGLSSPPSKLSPWSSNSIVKTPAVSLKELMATEEKKSRPVAVESMATSPNEKSFVRRQPPAIVYPCVSFASIIEAQEKAEMKHKKSCSKSLHLIQIEEQAIHQIEALYCARNNPDEWITVQRCATDAL